MCVEKLSIADTYKQLYRILEESKFFCNGIYLKYRQKDRSVNTLLYILDDTIYIDEHLNISFDYKIQHKNKYIVSSDIFCDINKLKSEIDFIIGQYEIELGFITQYYRDMNRFIYGI